MPIILFAAGIGCFVVGMEMGSSVAAYFDGPSLLIVLLPTALFGASFHTPEGLASAIRFALSEQVDPQKAQKASVTLRTLHSLAIATGIVGFLIGLVAMLANLDDPAKIGPAVAVAILCPLYGTLLAEFLFRPLSQRIESRVQS